MTKLSQRAGSLGASITLAINAKAKAIEAGGERVIRFGVGEPDFPTPDHIRAAATAAIADGWISGYTPVAGTPELRAAVADLFASGGVPTTPADVLVSCGAKQSLFNAFSVLLGDGDEIVLPAPYWVSYPSMAQANGASITAIDTRATGCILTPDALEAALTPRTRVLMFTSPSNPTGVAHTRQQIEALGDVLRRWPNVTVISDEIYRDLVYEETTFVSFAAACPDLRQRIVTVQGVSKSYAMTGWRIGFATGPREVVGAMTRFQSHTTSNPAAVSQAAALAALAGPREPVETMREVFDRRRRLMVSLLDGMDGVELFRPTGAFYCFPDIGALLGGACGATPLEFCDRLLEEKRVAAVPGEAFGAATNIRLSYATSEEDIAEGCRRIAEFVRA